MVATYTIFGRQIGSHYLALATLVSTGAIASWAVSGEKKQPSPPSNQASSKDEEEFIQEFIRQANAGEQKSKS